MSVFEGRAIYRSVPVPNCRSADSSSSSSSLTVYFRHFRHSLLCPTFFSRIRQQRQQKKKKKKNRLNRIVNQLNWINKLQQNFHFPVEIVRSFNNISGMYYKSMVRNIPKNYFQFLK